MINEIKTYKDNLLNCPFCDKTPKLYVFHTPVIVIFNAKIQNVKCDRQRYYIKEKIIALKRGTNAQK